MNEQKHATECEGGRPPGHQSPQLRDQDDLSGRHGGRALVVGRVIEFGQETGSERGPVEGSAR